MVQNDEQQNINGLKDLIASKLGFDAHLVDMDSLKEFDNFHIVEHILLRPKGAISLEFISLSYRFGEF